MTETVKKTTTRKPKAETGAKPAGKAPAKTTGNAPAKTNGKANGQFDNVTVMRSHVPPSHDQIAALAHRYWAERGYRHGEDASDWFRAEQELRAKAS